MRIRKIGVDHNTYHRYPELPCLRLPSQLVNLLSLHLYLHQG